MTNIILVMLAFFGASVGSFVNVAALRRAKNENFVLGRSGCETCGHRLVWFELVPLISWFVLLGKCRACKIKLSSRYVIVEIISAIIFVLSFMVYGFSLVTLLALPVSAILLAISLIDFHSMEIPDGLVIALIPLAIAAIWLMPDIGLLSRGIGFFAISLPMLALTIVIKGAFGGGDIKLMAVCGFLLGWQGIILAFFIAVLLGGSWAAYLLASGQRKRGQYMAFGPALCVGIFLSLLYGYEIIRLYGGLL